MLALKYLAEKLNSKPRGCEANFSNIRPHQRLRAVIVMQFIWHTRTHTGVVKDKNKKRLTGRLGNENERLVSQKDQLEIRRNLSETLESCSAVYLF